MIRNVGDGKTLVNGQSISVAALRHCDIITLGDRSLRWEYSAPNKRHQGNIKIIKILPGYDLKAPIPFSANNMITIAVEVPNVILKIANTIDTKNVWLIIKYACVSRCRGSSNSGYVRGARGGARVRDAGPSPRQCGGRGRIAGPRLTARYRDDASCLHARYSLFHSHQNF